jgi:hypothetical protein
MNMNSSGYTLYIFQELMPTKVKKSRIGGKQYLDYLWELGELPVYTMGGFGISVSLR